MRKPQDFTKKHTKPQTDNALIDGHTAGPGPCTRSLPNLSCAQTALDTAYIFFLGSGVLDKVGFYKDLVRHKGQHH